MLRIVLDTVMRSLFLTALLFGIRRGTPSPLPSREAGS
jgi:hypothetical protein